MRDCTVSVTSPKDGGRTHTVEVTALSKLDAAAQAIEAWSQLWWWDPDPDLTLLVKCGDLQWQVGARRVQAWQARWRDEIRTGPHGGRRARSQTQCREEDVRGRRGRS
jgi:hypothetical protein